MRMSWEEAERRGIVTPAERKLATAVRHENSLRYGQMPAEDRSREARRRQHRKNQGLDRLVCPIEGELPQERLWRLVVTAYPSLASSRELRLNYSSAIPERRFEVDIAMLPYRLALEVDGFQYHGRNLDNFKRDRLKDKLLTLQGWRCLRYTAAEINEDDGQLLEEIRQVVELRKLEMRALAGII